KEGALAERSASERERLLATLGADPAARTQPPHIRSQLVGLEKEQKARATRLTRDVIDRTLTDLLSVYRDALVVATRAPVAVVNEDTMDTLTGLARAFSPVGLLQAMEAIGVARERIAANVPPLLALEAMAVSLRLPR
ncbi:MAG: DNA polymerase III subunit delta', partial [Nostocoides sp.]